MPPYTLTILILFCVNSLLLMCFKDFIDWFKYRNSFIFAFIGGIFQIHALQNLANIKAWDFPSGSSLGVTLLNVDIEDIVFVPVCFSMFYLVMKLTSYIPDVLKNTPVKKILLVTFVLVEAFIYDRSGEAGKNLVVAYTMLPLLVLLMARFDFSKINTTQFIIVFTFIVSVNCGWDVLGVWLRHWGYNIESGVFGEVFKIYNRNHPIDIFLQYPISGTMWMYFSYLFFERRKHGSSGA